MQFVKTAQQPGRRRRRVALLLLAVLIPACAYLRAAPSTAVANPALEELSGLTRSLLGNNYLWAHNDSGDRARLFRVGLDGSDLGEVAVPEAVAIDWEDIATFSWQGTPALLIGDVGDNMASRKAVTLYAVRDPGPKGDIAPLLWQLNFSFPDGPRDVEGLAVDPRNGDILILSKRVRPPVVYRLPMPKSAPTPGKRLIAERLTPVLHIPAANGLDMADDPIFGLLRDWPTALDVSPDGSFAVVTTYKDAYLYRRGADESWASAFARTPETINLPQWKQTEAGAITADGQAFCAGSEQLSGFACMPLPHESYSSAEGTNP